MSEIMRGRWWLGSPLVTKEWEEDCVIDFNLLSLDYLEAHYDITPETHAPCRLFDGEGELIEGLVCKASSQTGWVCFFQVDESGNPVMEGDEAMRFYVQRPAPIRAVPDCLEDSKMSDPINPQHYRGKVELIEITEQLDFCRGNAVKYLYRAGKKDGQSAVQDLQKALWYVNRAIKQEREKEEQED